MKVRYIFDAGILALYFAGDQRVKIYLDEVFSGKAEGYISEVNLAEFYYKTAEKLGIETANIRYRMIRGSEIIALSPKGEVTRRAGELKLKYKNRLSLADCFLISHAEDLKAKIITTDHNIKQIAKKVIYIKI